MGSRNKKLIVLPIRKNILIKNKKVFKRNIMVELAIAALLISEFTY